MQQASARVGVTAIGILSLLPALARSADAPDAPPAAPPPDTAVLPPSPPQDTTVISPSVSKVDSLVDEAKDQQQKWQGVLNNNPISNSRFSGTWEGYPYQVEPLVLAVQPRLALHNPGARFDVHAMQWTLKDGNQGIRAEFFASNQDYMYGGRFAGPRVEYFDRWGKKFEHWELTTDLAVGAADNLWTHSSRTHIRIAQEALGGSEQAARWFGAGARFHFSASEGVQYDFRTHSPVLGERIFGGVQKPFKTHWFGKDRNFVIDAGLQVEGASHQGQHLSPRISVRLSH